MYQVGVIGLINAYRKYDKCMDTKFSTYAYFYILGEIKKYVREDRLLKVGRKISYLGSKIERVRELLCQKYNRYPSNLEISEYLEIDESIVNEAVNANNVIRSLDEELSEDFSLMDIICNDEDNFEYVDISDAIDKLDPYEKGILNSRYCEDMTQSEIAKNYNLSQVKISRDEQKILKKLRSHYAN